MIETSIVAHEIALFLKSNNILIPFSEKRLPYGWSTDSRQITFLDLSHYQAIEEYCPLDQIVTVQCGIKLHALEQFLGKNKQWLPIAYWNEETSLLDVILTGNAGPCEIVAGGLRRHILGLTFLLSNGVIAKSGGKVVKNVSGYDLTRYLIGSYGHFALPISASLRLYAAPEQTLTIMASSNNMQSLLNVIRSILTDRLSLVYMDLFDNRLLSAQLIELIRPNIITVAEAGYCLIMQIYGDQIAVETEQTIVQRLLNQLSLDYVIFSDNENQQKLLVGVTQIEACFNSKSEYGHIVELAVARRDFINICENKDLIAFPFLYRPISGKLLYCLKSLAEQNILLGLLDIYAKNSGKRLSIAYSDCTYMKKVVNLGEINADYEPDVAKAVKSLLKEKFDPDNLFNPFVDL